MPSELSAIANYPDTSRTEREAFLARLRSEPRFLLRHLRALGGAVLRRVRTRVVLKLADPHQGRKVQPAWLQPEIRVPGTPRALPGQALRLPAYPGRVVAPLLRLDPPAPEGSASGDPEDYLARQRWGFLTDALLTGSSDWERELARCVHWVESHPDKNDPCWEAYSSCERVANLLVFLAAMQATPQRPETPRQLREFLQDSLQWIRRRLEYYGPHGTNNHIINNGRAIVMAAVALGDAGSLAAGTQILKQCLPGLILAGGFLRERSSHYQLIVLNWLLDTWRFLGVANRPASAATWLREPLQRMLAATSLLCERDRMLSLVGDVSPDLTPTQSLARLQLLYPDFWPAHTQAPGPVRFNDGWFRMDAYDSTVLGNFPGGRFPAAFPTHGHADLSSFAWLHGGRDLLVDRGRYRYTPDTTSTFQKHASGHNLPLVNGFAPVCESLVPNGQWWPLPYAAARLETSVSDGSVTLAHDGFARATPVTRHARQLSLEPQTLVVVDSFAGAGEVELAFCWHFGGGFDTFDAQRMKVVGANMEISLQIEGVVGPPSAVLVDAAHGGWMSRAYGERQAALGICLRWRVPLPARIATQFSCSARER
jgi:hypothetical protein